MTFTIIRSFITILMDLVKLILDQKAHYLKVPENILSRLKAERIMRGLHFFPSLILAILFAVKVLPLFSPQYANELENNTFVIPIAFILSLIMMLVVVGIIIEKVLQRLNTQYAAYNKRLVN